MACKYDTTVLGQKWLETVFFFISVKNTKPLPRPLVPFRLLSYVCYQINVPLHIYVLPQPLPGTRTTCATASPLPAQPLSAVPNSVPAKSNSSNPLSNMTHPHPNANVFLKWNSIFYSVFSPCDPDPLSSTCFPPGVALPNVLFPPYSPHFLFQLTCVCAHHSFPQCYVLLLRQQCLHPYPTHHTFTPVLLLWLSYLIITLPTPPWPTHITLPTTTALIPAISSRTHASNSRHLAEATKFTSLPAPHRWSRPQEHQTEQFDARSISFPRRMSPVSGRVLTQKKKTCAQLNSNQLNVTRTLNSTQLVVNSV